MTSLTRNPISNAKRTLLARRALLAQRYRHLTGIPEREAIRIPEDDADRADELQTESFRSRLSEQEGRELEAIDDALARIVGLPDRAPQISISAHGETKEEK